MAERAVRNSLDAFSRADCRQGRGQGEAGVWSHGTA